MTNQGRIEHKIVSDRGFGGLSEPHRLIENQSSALLMCPIRTVGSIAAHSLRGCQQIAGAMARFNYTKIVCDDELQA
jgi:hypothetical protein